MLVIKLLLTTVPGLEKIVAREIRSLLGDSITEVHYSSLSGRVFCCVKDDNVINLLCRNVKTVEKIYLILHEVRFNEETCDVNELISSLSSIPLHEYISPFMSFRVSVNKLATMEQTSSELARLLGQKIIEILEKHYGFAPTVILDNPDVTFYAEFSRKHFLLCIDITGYKVSLRDRGYKVYIHPSSLNPIIAYSMFILANPSNGERVLDPLCGSGTILIEAANDLCGSDFIGIDINFKHVLGAKTNALAAGVYSRMHLIVSDATLMDKLFRVKIRYIISNLPYGIRIRLSKRFLRKFLKALSNIISPGGIACLLSLKNIRDIAENLGFTVLDHFRIRQGDVYPRIVILTR
ncbi:MAG TPA: methyltransferase domain-containing protein [Thermoprotei archaeon]|nr:methyltransferase domain-containing protein [Thermoprotei archaeon]